jgi:hypothetical protein
LVPLKSSQTIFDDISESIISSGYFFSSEVSFCTLSVTDQLLKLGRQLGEIRSGRFGRLVEVLSPTDSSRAQINSLSAIHGHGNFPYHIDGSHFSTPSRYLIFHCTKANGQVAPTYILHQRDINFTVNENEAMRTGVFLVRNGKRSFYASILSKDVPFMRWDEGCMQPKDKKAKIAVTALSQLPNNTKRTTIHWTKGSLLVIDNWRVLHARGQTTDQNSQRKLLRVSVK